MSKILFLKLVALLVSTIISIILGNYLEPKAFGKIQYIQRLIDLGIVFSNFGLKEIGIKKIQQLIHQPKNDKTRDLVYSYLALTFALSLASTIFLSKFLKDEFLFQQILSIGIFFVCKSLFKLY